VSDPEPLVISNTLVPYDLVATVAMFGPAHNRSHSEARLYLGYVADESGARPELTVWSWTDCKQPCPVVSPVASHEAGAVVTITVPCDSLPHCHACECGSGHQITLLPDQVVNLKLMLP
jgi:hypothetical protein